MSLQALKQTTELYGQHHWGHRPSRSGSVLRCHRAFIVRIRQQDPNMMKAKTIILREREFWVQAQSAVDHRSLLAFIVRPLLASELYSSPQSGVKSFIFWKPRLIWNQTNAPNDQKSGCWHKSTWAHHKGSLLWPTESIWDVPLTLSIPGCTEQLWLK